MSCAGRAQGAADGGEGTGGPAAEAVERLRGGFKKDLIPAWRQVGGADPALLGDPWPARAVRAKFRQLLEALRLVVSARRADWTVDTEGAALRRLILARDGATRVLTIKISEKLLEIGDRPPIYAISRSAGKAVADVLVDLAANFFAQDPEALVNRRQPGAAPRRGVE